MEATPIKPVRHSSPPSIAVGGHEWIKSDSLNKAWSFYEADAFPAFHISVENKSGRAHASPRGGVLEGKSLHVYELGNVVNYVSFALRVQVDEWLQNADQMRVVCGGFRTAWPGAMDDMHAQYAQELQKYHELRNENREDGMSEEGYKKWAREVRASRNRLDEAAAGDVCEIQVDSPGLWLVSPERGHLCYAVPASHFVTAKIGDLWTDSAIDLAGSGNGFFLATKGKVVYVCLESRLKKKVNKRDRLILKLPQADISCGLLRTPGINYRVSASEIKLLMTSSRNVDVEKNGHHCFRVEIGGETYVVRPDGGGLGLTTDEAWRESIAKLPEAEMANSFVETSEGKTYLWKGAFPPEPEDLAAAHHKVMTSDGMFVADLGDTKYFTTVKDVSRKRDMWLRSLPRAKGELLPHGTLVLKLKGAEYVVARGCKDQFIEAASGTATGTPGSFSYGIGSNKLIAINPVHLARYMMKKEKWEGIIRKPGRKATLVKGHVVTPEGVKFKVIKLPEYDVSYRGEYYTLVQGEETLIIDPYQQTQHFKTGKVELPEDRGRWMHSLPVGVIDSTAATASVAIDGVTRRYKMHPSSWNRIADVADKIPIGTPNCFVLRSLFDVKSFIGPIRLDSSELCSVDEWDKWIKGLPLARKVPDIPRSLYIYGTGAEAMCIEVEWDVYKSPMVGTENCLVVEDEELSPLAVGSDYMQVYDLNADEFIAEFGPQVWDSIRELAGMNTPVPQSAPQEYRFDIQYLALHNSYVLSGAETSAPPLPDLTVDSPHGEIPAYRAGDQFVISGDSAYYDEANLGALASENGWCDFFIRKINDGDGKFLLRIRNYSGSREQVEEYLAYLGQLFDIVLRVEFVD
ncbi:hypothetical protein ACIQMR_31525 [Streptomyces sp. NPDC091376]|uniref:hypothetical protein n=1 Tax=Streptomyces sp. NPDC091376 TaxID=3365994 RepID=UPI00381B0473